MKRFIITFSVLLGLLVSSSAFAGASRQDLISRLNNYTPEKYRAAVEDLRRKFPDTYKPDSKWEQYVQQLEKDKNSLITRLRAEDKKAEQEAADLLKKLDAVLLANPLVADKQVAAIRRTLGKEARTGMGGTIGVAPSNFQNNSEIHDPKGYWTNEFVSLTVAPGKVKMKELYKPAPGMIITDPELHFDGERLMYSSIGTNDRWHLFELDLATGKTTQLTPESYEHFDSFDGCYTADGRYIFCSTGTFLGLPCTNGWNKMCGLFMYDPKTGQTRQLTFDQDSNWDPVMMENGTVLYQRWEYADIPHSNSRIMFTMNPDGTTQTGFYGSNSYFPTSFFNARPIPGHPSKIVGVATGHHSVSRSGRLMVIDVNKGRHETDGVVAEIPHSGRPVEPIVRDRLPDGVWPQFLKPYPLNDTYFIVSMKSSPNSLWGLYLVDTFDNRTLIAEEEEVAFLEPVLLEKRKTPNIIPDRVNLADSTATVFIQDIYEGEGLKGIPRGTVKKLRVGSYVFSPYNQGGLLGTIGMDGPWDIRTILGEVEMEEDGSVMFKVPANTAIFVQPLDEEGKALQMMRSWFTGMPGEVVSCIGCHEDKNTIPPPRMSAASKKAPKAIEKWYGEERGFSYRHEVQPVLDKYCISCHGNEEKTDRPYLKGDKWITDWNSQISGHADPSYGGHFTLSYTYLHRYVRRPGIESDMHMLVPMDVHADQTELFQILQKGHYGVEMDREAWEKLACWVDFNAPFHGRRSDIPNFPETEESNDLRELYREMFGGRKRNNEWLPEIPQNIQAVAPVKKAIPAGDTVLEKWPYYTPSETAFYDKGWGNTCNRQLWLGEFQRNIPIADGIVLQMIKVPAGSFIMGSDRHPDEMPQNVVTIEKPFWIGRFEITNRQYRVYDSQHDSRDEHRHGYQFGRRGYSMNGEEQPAVRISWREAMEYCEWLSEQTGMKFTLPTEAQWEWACRAGSDTPFWFGGQGADFSRFANLGDIMLRDFAACTAAKNYESTRIIPNPNRYDDWIPRDTTYNDGGFISEPVGRYIQNPWDLHDMHGNVWEWTLSQYASYPYLDGDGRNDTGVSEAKRVARGGSWYDRPYRSTSSYRLPYRDYQKVYNVGFRVVMMEE